MNYKRIVLLLAVLFVSLLSFAQSPATEVKINPRNITKGDLMLTDLAASIEYIPLETRDNCLIGYISYCDISTHFILVFCHQSKAVYLFKRNGQFVRKIGNLGQGPSEYLNEVKSVYIDEANNQILISDYVKILYFSLDGKFLHSKSVFSSQRMFLAYFDELFLTGLFSGVFHDSTYHVYNIIDREGKLLTKGVPSVMVRQNTEALVSVATIGHPMFHYMYEGMPHVMEMTLNDTLYRVTPDNRFVPKYVLNAGSYAITPEIRANTDSYFDTIKDYVALLTVNETRNYLLIFFSYKEKYYYCYYHKQTGTLHSFDSSTGIPNDYDGYFDVSIMQTTVQKENELYIIYDAPDFLEAAAKKKREAHAPKEAMQKLQSILKKTDEESNPILLIATLK